MLQSPPNLLAALPPDLASLPEPEGSRSHLPVLCAGSEFPGFAPTAFGVPQVALLVHQVAQARVEELRSQVSVSVPSQPQALRYAPRTFLPRASAPVSYL